MNLTNLKFAILGSIAALGVTGGTLAATSAPLHAAELVVTAKAPQARILYDDLDLAGRAGIARLDARIRAAAGRLCDATGVRDLGVRLAADKCRAELIAAAAPQAKQAEARFGTRYAAAAGPLVLAR
ncbi:MAG: UrcA family protein [Allosphingosinicella sp.]